MTKYNDANKHNKRSKTLMLCGVRLTIEIITVFSSTPDQRNFACSLVKVKSIFFYTTVLTAS